ncbi:MAG TPA: hypothetical protein VFU43_29175 [Streptosporangiaceae bacterium]|nr:hypothetical protein [Streptosporangiaceae bacterium]
MTARRARRPARRFAATLADTFERLRDKPGGMYVVFKRRDWL